MKFLPKLLWAKAFRPFTETLLGCGSLGLYAAAVVGVGFAAGGLWRTSLAAELARFLREREEPAGPDPTPPG